MSSRFYYDNYLSTVASLKEKKPKLLLHTCCAPCLSGVIDEVSTYFNVTVYFYNPNINSSKEYEYRAREVKRFIDLYNNTDNINVITEDYDKDEFLSLVQGYEDAPERGARCSICFSLRLEKTANFANNNGYDYFATTLTVSPLKNADVINEIGLDIASRLGTIYLTTDFKKNDGFKKSIDNSKKYNLYRQNYCGCIFSQIDRIRKTTADIIDK